MPAPIPPPFEVSQRLHGTTRTLAASGELDIASAPALADALGAAMRDQPEIVPLDLGEVDFIDSSGLRTILRARVRAEEHGIRLVVVQSQAVHRLFELCGVHGLLSVASGNGHE